MRLTDSAKYLIDGKNFGNLATSLPDSSPHVAPVWVDRDEDVILVNTADGRVKHKNLVKDPRVALSIYDQSNPYKNIVIFGRVAEITKKGAEDHIDKMAMKYLGLEKYPYPDRHPVVDRVLIKIEALHVSEESS